MSVIAIAERAGVSITTVSRVLNNDPKVRPETAQQVMKAAAELSYDRFKIRRGPRPGRRLGSDHKMGLQRIALVLLGADREDWFKNSVFASVFSSISRAASARGISVDIFDQNDPAKLDTAIVDQRVNGGIAFMASTADPQSLNDLSIKLPVLLAMGGEMSNTLVDQVRPNNLTIGTLAYGYLAQHNVKRTAFVSSRMHHGGIYLRYVGFVAAAAHVNAPTPHAFAIGEPPAGSMGESVIRRCASLPEIADRIAAATERYDGLFISQDIETIGLYPLLTERGLQPGRDIRIISCNAEEGLALLTPRPATIDIGTSELGRWAIQRLSNRVLRPTEAPVQLLVTPRLVLADASTL